MVRHCLEELRRVHCLRDRAEEECEAQLRHEQPHLKHLWSQLCHA